MEFNPDLTYKQFYIGAWLIGIRRLPKVVYLDGVVEVSYVGLLVSENMTPCPQGFTVYTDRGRRVLKNYLQHNCIQAQYW
jgi:hypothetical protein